MDSFNTRKERIKSSKSDILQFSSDEQILKHLNDDEKYEDLKNKLLKEFSGEEMSTKLINATLTEEYHAKRYWKKQTYRGIEFPGVPKFYHKFCKEVFASNDTLMKAHKDDINEILKGIPHLFNRTRYNLNKRKRLSSDVNNDTIEEND